MDFNNPDLNMQVIAEGFGVRTETINNLETIGEVIGRALAHKEPSLLIIDREP